MSRISPRADQRRYASRLQRQRALERDGFHCRYCGVIVTNETANMDHRIPWRHGGPTRLWNLVTACQPCNKDKSNRNPWHWQQVKGAR